MCDWPVYGLSGRIDCARMCQNGGRHHQVGPLSVCARHLGILVTGVLDAVHREARGQIEDGRATPGGIEEMMRLALAEVSRERRERRSVNGGRKSVVYFVEREGYVKIGTTINLAGRLTMLATSSMLPGMTAGPVTLLATIPGGTREERALHKRFWHLRVNPAFEWFRHEGKLRAFVEELAS